ncbi:hypothetical protein LPI72_02385 [Klebsiella pneumoniae]|nr:hypothetical protein [Klebsiella pneumoniae]
MFMKVDIDTQDVRYADAWLGFRGTAWQTQIDVRDFIQHNYTPYEGDESFLADATPATTALWEQVMAGIRVRCAVIPTNEERMIALDAIRLGRIHTAAALA